jgi:predicted phage terminase large subunit-like protein
MITVPQYKPFQKKEATVTTYGVGGNLVSQHYDVIIMDDVVNRDLVGTPEQIQKTILFYKDALDLLEPSGTLIIIGTRWSDADLYGWILDKSNPERAYEDFSTFIRQAYTGNLETETDLKLLFPEKFTRDILVDLKKNKGPLEFANQYMNDPMPSEEAKFKPQWFKQVLEDELKWRQMTYYTTVDPAIGQNKNSDRTAIVTVGVDEFNNWFLVNVIWEKLLPSDTINYIFANWERFQPRQIGVEMVAFQKSLQYALHDEMRRRNIYLPIVELKASRSKEERIEGLIPRYANGSIYHLTQCPFREELEEELMRFPRGKHDDCADALAYMNQIAHQSRGNKPRFNRGSSDSEDRKKEYLY